MGCTSTQTYTLSLIHILPKTYVNLDGDDAAKMLTLFDLLESHDDVSRVYANFDIPEDILDQNA